MRSLAARLVVWYARKGMWPFTAAIYFSGRWLVFTRRRTYEVLP